MSDGPVAGATDTRAPAPPHRSEATALARLAEVDEQARDDAKASKAAATVRAHRTD